MAILQQVERHPNVLDRTYLKAKDQHGRKWGALISKRTMAPVGAIEPLGWTAPFMPAQQYIKWRVGEEEIGYSVFIDYDAMVRDREVALRDWNQRLVEVGFKMNGQAFDARKPTPEVLALVGPKPHPKEIPLAAQAGEPWVLGLSDRKPRWAQTFFPETVHDPLAFLQQTDDDASDDEPEAVVAPVKRGPGRPRKAASTE